jgi:cwf18 pre-mRNA splicing factor
MLRRMGANFVLYGGITAHSSIYSRDQPRPIPLKGRNFDPETRTLRKRDPVDALEDTVERNVEGVADQIIAEDAERRQQELVCATPTQVL